MKAHASILSALVAAAVLLGLAAPAAAQPQATQGRGGTVGKVKVDFTEVRAGPGAAYLSQGRAYQGDEVKVLDRDPGGEWLQVEANGLKGWVKAVTVALQARTAGPSAGRDRRQQNYTYDAQGRRVFADGSAMGSGEGMGEHQDTEVGDKARTEPGRFRIRLGFGGSRISRDWTAAIEPDSALARLGVNSMAISTEVEASFDALPWLQIRALFRDARLSEAVVPPNEGFGFPDGLGLDVNSQQAELDVVGRYALADGKVHVGGYLGGHLFRHAFQETRPFALFLSNTFVGLGVGAVVDARFGPGVELGLRGGLVKPFTVAQSPADSGDPSPIGGQVQIEAGWWFHERWAVVATGHFMVLQTDWSGASTHADPYTGPEPRNYERAREEDRVMGGGLGIRFRP